MAATNKSKSAKPSVPSYMRVPGPTNEELDARQAAAEAERIAKGYPKVEVTREPLDKKIQERSDFLDQEHADPMLAPNPMEEVVGPYKDPNFAYKFLSPGCTRVLGTRGYEVVKDEHGDPVTLGNLKLGRIPKRIADARKRKAEADSQERVKSMAEEYAQSVNRLKREGQDLGLRVLEPGEVSGDFMNTETGRTVHIG